METAKIIHNGREVDVFKPENREYFVRFVDDKEARELFHAKGYNYYYSIYGADCGEWPYRKPVLKRFPDITFGESLNSMYYIVFYYNLGKKQPVYNVDKLINKKEEK